MTRRLLAITDPRYPLEHLVEIARALPRGAAVVQYRDPSGAKYDTAKVLRDASRASGSLFVINGDVALAADLGADGVHLGGVAPDIRGARVKLGDAFVSVAAHDDDDVERACKEGATAALVSPIFETAGKGSPRGLQALHSARRTVGERGLLIYALGGIDLRRAASCIDAGADGVAAIRGFFEDPEAAGLAKAESRW